MPSKSTALLTEYLDAADNTDPSIDGPAALTYAQTATGVWQIDSGEPLPAAPDEYRVECEECEEVFGSWGAATRHAESEHIAERKRTSILAYEDELETLNRARRQLEYERDEDLALHEALVIMADEYLDDDP